MDTNVSNQGFEHLWTESCARLKTTGFCNRWLQYFYPLFTLWLSNRTSTGSPTHKTTASFLRLIHLRQWGGYYK